jgi:hypothetical protein
MRTVHQLVVRVEMLAEAVIVVLSGAARCEAPSTMRLAVVGALAGLALEVKEAGQA